MTSLNYDDEEDVQQCTSTTSKKAVKNTKVVIYMARGIVPETNIGIVLDLYDYTYDIIAFSTYKNSNNERVQWHDVSSYDKYNIESYKNKVYVLDGPPETNRYNVMQAFNSYFEPDCLYITVAYIIARKHECGLPYNFFSKDSPESKDLFPIEKNYLISGIEACYYYAVSGIFSGSRGLKCAVPSWIFNVETPIIHGAMTYYNIRKPSSKEMPGSIEILNDELMVTSADFRNVVAKAVATTVANYVVKKKDKNYFHNKVCSDPNTWATVYKIITGKNFEPIVLSNEGYFDLAPMKIQDISDLHIRSAGSVEQLAVNVEKKIYSTPRSYYLVRSKKDPETFGIFADDAVSKIDTDLYTKSKISLGDFPHMNSRKLQKFYICTAPVWNYKHASKADSFYNSFNHDLLIIDMQLSTKSTIRCYIVELNSIANLRDIYNVNSDNDYIQSFMKAQLTIYGKLVLLHFDQSNIDNYNRYCQFQEFAASFLKKRKDTAYGYVLRSLSLCRNLLSNEAKQTIEDECKMLSIEPFTLIMPRITKNDPNNFIELYDDKLVIGAIEEKFSINDVNRSMVLVDLLRSVLCKHVLGGGTNALDISISQSSAAKMVSYIIENKLAEKQTIIECFASPFDLVLPSGSKYCSLYSGDPNSLGDFYKLSIMKSQMLYMNPPMSIAVYKKIFEQLQGGVKAVMIMSHAIFKFLSNSLGNFESADAGKFYVVSRGILRTHTVSIATILGNA
jgi:hypothetical protein